MKECREKVKERKIYTGKREKKKKIAFSFERKSKRGSRGLTRKIKSHCDNEKE